MISAEWESVEAINEGQRRRLPAGGYVIRITNVTNEIANQRLWLEYDIAEGPLAGYYQTMTWAPRFMRSYKPRALGFFKGFIKAVEAANPGLVLQINDKDIDETKLKGAIIGAVLCDEEYEGNDGRIKTRLNVEAILSPEDIRKGNFTVPEPKKLQPRPTPETVSAAVVDMTAQETPKGFEELESEVPF